MLTLYMKETACLLGAALSLGAALTIIRKAQLQQLVDITQAYNAFRP